MTAEVPIALTSREEYQMPAGVDPTISAAGRGTVVASQLAVGDGGTVLPKLTIGQAVSATVLRVLPEGGVMIGLLDQLAMAPPDSPVKRLSANRSADPAS